MTFEEVRKSTITLGKGVNNKDPQSFLFGDLNIRVRDPKLWLPPKACLMQYTSLIKCMIQYLESAGQHDASLPDMSESCLTSDGLHYNFGNQQHFTSIVDILPEYSVRSSRKRALEMTPKKDKSRKKTSITGALTSTPSKHK